MRTREVLVEGFEEIKTLMQYLYMDENNYIAIPGTIITFQFFMNEDMEIYNYDKYTGTKYPRPLTISDWLACVERLKEQPSDCGYGNFSNKWEEIKTITLMQVALNKGV